MTPRLLLSAAAVLTVCAHLAANPAADGLLPLKPEVRKVIDASCVMCHGEVIDGGKEIRDDLDLSTDELLGRTLASAGKLKQVILEDKMPHKPRLSRRLRDNAELQARLVALRENYKQSGHKEILLDWLKDVTATTGDDKKKE
ncbi:MAG: hypothetical protein QG602_4163 [Verrucomicrobiota bacterium]|nr:hypothetical protein [Verrucomicrobiota bacterium]